MNKVLIVINSVDESGTFHYLLLIIIRWEGSKRRRTSFDRIILFGKHSVHKERVPYIRTDAVCAWFLHFLLGIDHGSLVSDHVCLHDGVIYDYLLIDLHPLF